MTDISRLPDDVISKLLNTITSKISNHTPTNKNFIIQYSYFEFINNEWILKTFLDVGDETLDKIHLKISSRDFTNIYVNSVNPGYGKLRITNKLDMRDKSNLQKIYVCDLYDNFEPLHYEGICSTA